MLPASVLITALFYLAVATTTARPLAAAAWRNGFPAAEFSNPSPDFVVLDNSRTLVSLRRAARQYIHLFTSHETPLHEKTRPVLLALAREID